MESEAKAHRRVCKSARFGIERDLTPPESIGLAVYRTALSSTARAGIRFTRLRNVSLKKFFATNF
jgi:hypothetical protein